MRIAQVAPLAESVPPKLYGGTERVVSWLTEELVALGHEVTLFASGDSVTNGTLIPIVPRALRLSRPRPDPFPAYAMQLDAVAEAAADFDIVHCHIDWLHLPVLNRLGIPHLTTTHNRLDTPDLPAVINRFRQAPMISISDNHRVPLPSANWLGTVYHGMPSETLEPSYEQGNYLAFLGRLAKRRAGGCHPVGQGRRHAAAYGRQDSTVGNPLLQGAIAADHRRQSDRTRGRAR
jgi:glycosyltransferase involved in cell wall biosynthesis